MTFPVPFCTIFSCTMKALTIPFCLLNFLPLCLSGSHQHHITMTSLLLPLCSLFFQIFVLQFRLPSSSLLSTTRLLPASIFIPNNLFCHLTAKRLKLPVLIVFHCTSNSPFFITSPTNHFSINGTNIYVADHIPATSFLPEFEHLNISFSSVINILARHTHPSICSSFSLFMFRLQYSIFLFKQKHLGAGRKYLHLWCINFRIHFLAWFVENHSSSGSTQLHLHRETHTFISPNPTSLCHKLSQDFFLPKDTKWQKGTLCLLISYQMILAQCSLFLSYQAFAFSSTSSTPYPHERFHNLRDFAFFTLFLYIRVSKPQQLWDVGTSTLKILGLEIHTS